MNIMIEVLNTIWKWSEVWALLIPLIILLIFKPKGKSIRPLIIYVYVGFGLNLISTILYVYHYQMPVFLQNNNIYYNLHSIARVIFFSWFILSIRSQKSLFFYRILILAYGIFIVANFAFFENILFLSSHIHTIESITLIVLCSIFFLNTIWDNSDINWLSRSSFFVCAAIGLYEVIGLFIFLFFYELAGKDKEFGQITMLIRKISLIILCLLLCLSFIQAARKKSAY